jgi:hypothetical protein
MASVSQLLIYVVESLADILRSPPSAEDLLYSSPTPVFWPLKPAGRYGRVTPDIIGTVCQHLLDDCCYRDCDWLALACRGLGLDPEWTDELVIRINEPLLDSGFSNPAIHQDCLSRSTREDAETARRPLPPKRTTS